MPLNFGLLQPATGQEAANAFYRGEQEAVQNQLRQMQLIGARQELEESQRKIQRQRGLEQTLSGFKPEMSTEQQAGELIRRGYLTEAKSLVESQAKAAKDRREAEKAQIDAALQKLDLTGRVFGSVTDEPTYQQALANFKSLGIDTSELSPTYNPAQVAQYRNQAVSYKDRLTSEIKEYQFAQNQGYKGSFTDFVQIKPKAGATQVSVGPQEKAEQVERGKFLTEDYKTISNAARVAARTLPAIETNLALLNKGFDTGFATETMAAGASVLGALGVKDAAKFATNAQVFKSKISESVLEKQLLQKGPQTEADAQRITQTSAQLGNTKEANQFLLDVAKAQLKRDMEQRQFYDDWWKKNKTYDGAEDAWYSGEGGKSLFDRADLKKYGMGAKTGTTTATTPATKPAPAVGTVQQGYRFKGGDPGNQANWEKVK